MTEKQFLTKLVSANEDYLAKTLKDKKVIDLDDVEFGMVAAVTSINNKLKERLRQL